VDLSVAKDQLHDLRERVRSGPERRQGSIT
jgi:hypothetical protein